MEIDGDLEVVTVTKPAGTFLNGGDLGIQPPRHGVGDAMLEIGQHIRQVSGNQLGHIDHGRQTAVRGPEIPALPEALGPAEGAIAPPLTQGLLQRPGACRLQVAVPNLGKSPLSGRRHVLGAVEPQVLAAQERLIALREQRFVLLLAHTINALSNMLHDVKAVKHHLVLGPGNLCLAGIDVGRPHVQADHLDLRSLLFIEGCKVRRQTFHLTAFADIFHARCLQITDQRHVLMSFSDCFLAHPQMLGHLRALGGSAADHRSLHQAPSLIPRYAQNSCGSLHVGRQQHVDREHFKQMREPAPRLGPRQTHLAHAMLGIRHARRASIQVGQELTTIQMPPDALGQMVVHGKLLPTLRAAKSHHRHVLRIHINMHLRPLQIHPLNRPRLVQPKQMPVQLFALHRASPL